MTRRAVKARKAARKTVRKVAGKRTAKSARKAIKPKFFVYVLGCRVGAQVWTYVGWTNDLARRLARHNAGTGARTTRGRLWVLLHSERLRSKPAAMSREWHLKRDSRFRKRLANAWISTPGAAVPI